MAVGGHSLSDSLDLLCEPQLEEPISFIEYHHLYLRELETCLGDAVHETTGCCDNDIWIQQESLELVFHVVATDDKTVGQVGVLGELLEILSGLES